MVKIVKNKNIKVLEIIRCINYITFNDNYNNVYKPEVATTDDKIIIMFVAI